jgi:hypothetical protein
VPEPLLGPRLEPGAGGAVVLPEAPAGSQSFIADCASAELLLLPSVLALPLLLALEPGLLLWEAEPFGPQSGFAIEPLAPDIELVPDFAPAPVSVCAMAAPPSVSARAETAVTRKRFIGVLRVACDGHRGPPADTVGLIAAFACSFRSIRKVDPRRP